MALQIHHEHVAILWTATGRMVTEATGNTDQWAVNTLKKTKGKEHYRIKRSRQGKRIRENGTPGSLAGHKHVAM